MSDIKKLPKICEICGEKANGRNFSVISCESCKAFFRRNAFKESLDCPSNGNCIITAKTRKLCQKCRLNKCFTAGMKKEMLKNIEERESRKKLVEENRQKKQLKQQQYCVEDNIRSVEESSTMTTGSPQSQTSPPHIDTDIIPDDNDCNDYLMKIIDSTLIISDDELRDQIQMENFDDDDIIDNNELADKNTTYSIFDGTLPLERLMRLKHRVVPIYRELVDHNGLNQLETNRITEIIDSSAKLFQFTLCKDNIIKMSNMLEVIQLSARITEQSVMNCINFTKSLQSFRNCCPDDQLSLIKYGCGEILFVRSIDFYDKKLKNFIIPIDSKTSIYADMQAFCNEYPDYYNSFMQLFYKLLDKFLPAWNEDRVIIDLLSVILLFDPNRPNLKHRHNIKLEQQLYIYLLQRYLLLKLKSESESCDQIYRLMTTVSDTHTISNLQRHYGIKEYKKYLKYYGPLLREMFWPDLDDD
ncbi:nuclear hormone receptor HR96-like [Oppia nitens]|uniref:nuclear hormone receptor HR96-like n=1 Tax=Oppia nitens TaxID=1686743 RepID=UPI0023DA98A5|nr:nuclear hormone receptor HR96-like [Oppia nitens]